MFTSFFSLFYFFFLLAKQVLGDVLNKHRAAPSRDPLPRQSVLLRAA